jgi:uncharacterized protein YcbX
VRIGDVTYRFAEHCDRCVMTTIDPATTATGKEPLRTLARHRRWGGKTWFGIRLVPTARGTLAPGDDVEVLLRDELSAPVASAGAARGRRPA